MAAEPPKSTSSADSYIGSLISLTSKSEIRYEGILYSINTEESSIGLRNVRSFGSEGRKKDGPQIPPSDRVYEYILFRGTDIKDLQVKSSPPVQTTSSVDNDPAIIQSHYPRPPALSTSLPSAVSVSPTDANSHAPQLVHPGSNFPGGIPLYQPGAGLGSWGPSPPPSMNGPMPMYWPGMYGHPNGLPQLHQHALLRPPPGLSVPPTLQQQMPYSGFNAPPQAAAPNASGSDSTLLTISGGSAIPGFNPPSTGPLNVPSSISPLLAASGSSTAFPASSLPPFSLPGVLSGSVASEAPPSSVFNRVSNSVLPSMPLNVGLPTLTSLTISGSETISITPPASSNVNSAPSSTLPYQNLSQAATSIVTPSTPSHNEAPTPSLVTPDQLLQPGHSQISTHSSEIAHKNVELVQGPSSSDQSVPVLKEKEAQPPILPLPSPSAPRAYHKPNSGGPPIRHNHRGGARGRGNGGSRPVTRFTEDFDFTAMNEKFNKDEVWDHLGKSNKHNSKDKEGDEDEEDGYEVEDASEVPKSESKAVYNKDDFFDSLSCNSFDNQPQNGRPRFSEQLKLDTETFGEFSRYRGGRGGRGPGRSYRGGRGSNYGRGYGYSGSGRGYGYGGRGGRGRPLSSQAS